MKAITVCVGAEYAALLAITLPRNTSHFERTLVVTSTTDDTTPRVADQFPKVDVLRTHAFYEREAVFNKGAALEQGFDFVGRDGWICVLDADVILPNGIEFCEQGDRLAIRYRVSSRRSVATARIACEVGGLYVPRRRLCLNPADYSGQSDWDGWPVSREREHPGYFQIFHAEDPRLLGRRPWYGIDWMHAGGCDSDFQVIWPAGARHWLPFDVLHLGEPCANWWAGDRARMRQMYADRKRFGFRREKLS